MIQPINYLEVHHLEIAQDIKAPIANKPPAAITVNIDYEIAGLENGATYCFTVTAVDHVNQESGYSNEASAAPKTVPAPPKNLYAKASSRKAVISCDASLDDGRNFYPKKKTTRAEFVQIIVTALGLMQKGAGKALFSDVAKEDEYYDTVTIAYEYGIISGYGDGSFAPDKEITREEAMAMMVRAMKAAGIEVSLSEDEMDALISGYKDVGSIAPWARESAAICIKLGIVNGRSDGSIAPKDSTSMVEMVAMAYRMLTASDLI